MMRFDKKRSSRCTLPSFSAVHIVLAFLMGYFLGHYHARDKDNHPQIHGSFQQLDSVPVRSTSHVDDQGRPITKQQLIDPFILPRLAGISVATLQPHQTVTNHQHESMHEFFFVLQGTGTFSVDDTSNQVSTGSFVHCAPHESHEIIGPADVNDDPLKMLVVGVTLD